MNSSVLTNLTEEDWSCPPESLLDQSIVRYPLIFMYMSVFVLCLFGNLFTVIVIILHPTMRTSTNFFLANLAAADLLVAVFCILQNMAHLLVFENANWPWGRLMCKMYVLVLHLVPCTSVGILVCVSVEKYIAVLHPLTAMKVLTQRLRCTVTIGIWVVSLATNLVYFYGTTTYEFGSLTACARAIDLKIWVTVSFAVWYVIPLIVLAYIYTRIGRLLWTTVGSSRANIGQSSDSQGSTGASWQMSNGRIVVYKQESLLQVPEDPQSRRRRKDMMEGRKKVIRLLFAVVLSFAVLTLPHHARLLEAMWNPTQTCNSDLSILLQPISYLALFVSSAINPVLYAFLSRRFREAVSDIIHCRKGWFSRVRSRTRTRTLVSDMPDDSRAASPHLIRMNRIRQN